MIDLSSDRPASARLSAPVLILTAICSLVYLLDGLIHSILGPLAPSMARSLELSNAELGPVFSSNLRRPGRCAAERILDSLAALSRGHAALVAPVHLDAHHQLLCLNSWLPTLLVAVGRDERFAALSVSIFSLGGIVAALGVGVLIDRFGASRTLVTFLAISTALFVTLGQMLATASDTLLTMLLGACASSCSALTAA
ncbi:MAG TPA: hypothetical protein VFX89_03780 [Gammaproteobacteria bacterium]|nr:hypothetical protein [Gammaproteobacteria bacterium]